LQEVVEVAEEYFNLHLVVEVVLVVFYQINFLQNQERYIQ
jgi:hypothetical protein